MSYPLKHIFLPFAAICLILLPIGSYAALESVDPLGGTAGAGEKGSADLLFFIRNIVNTFLTLGGVVAAIAMVIGGVMYINTYGEEDRARQAKMVIIYATIGLIVIVLSGVLVNFVINAVGGSRNGAAVIQNGGRSINRGYGKGLPADHSDPITNPDSQNPPLVNNPLDVDRDGQVTASDHAFAINCINSTTLRCLRADVNNDGMVSPIDAEIIRQGIN